MESRRIRVLNRRDEDTPERRGDMLFDGLTRSLGAASSRRVVSAVVAGALTGLLTGAGGRNAAAKSKKKKCKPKCPPGQIKVGPGCVTWQGTCAAGDNSCGRTSGITCNGVPNCVCAPSVNSGTRCGVAPQAIRCGQCTRDGDCSPQFGPGAFCVLATNTQTALCSCGQVGQGFCMLPCPG
jgi:hypothetical protein